MAIALICCTGAGVGRAVDGFIRCLLEVFLASIATVMICCTGAGVGRAVDGLIRYLLAVFLGIVLVALHVREKRRMNFIVCEEDVGAMWMTCARTMGSKSDFKNAKAATDSDDERLNKKRQAGA